MVATTNEKDLLLHTPVGDAAVVTARTPRGFETRVLCGRLDGWVLPLAGDEPRARYNHRWVVRLVRDSESPSGLQLRREAETN